MKLAILGATVAGLNIFLNYLIATAASRSSSWAGLYFDPFFGVAMVVGVVSLSAMGSLYYLGQESRFGLANGVLLMGALSISGGTLLGYYKGNAIHWSEWLLLALILGTLSVANLRRGFW
jgi:hypothetical protein